MKLVTLGTFVESPRRTCRCTANDSQARTASRIEGTFEDPVSRAEITPTIAGRLAVATPSRRYCAASPTRH